MGKQPRVAPTDVEAQLSNSEFGPVANRKCRDVLFLLIFLLMWAALIVLAIIAFYNGNINIILMGKDTTGSFCGIDNTVYDKNLGDRRDLPYLYYLDLTSPNSLQVCVKECPLASVSNIICYYGVTYSLDAIQNRRCMPSLYDSRAILGRCLPSAGFIKTQLAAANITSSASDAFSIAQMLLEDLAVTWPHILITIAASLILCFVWMFLLRFLTGIITWFGIIMCHLVLAGIATLSYLLYSQNSTLIDKIASSGIANSTAGAVAFQQLQQAMALTTQNADKSRAEIEKNAALGILIGSCLLFALFFLMTIALRKRIKIATKVLKESSRAFAAMPTLAFYPVSTFFAILAVTAFCGAIAIFIAVSPQTASLGAFGRNDIVFDFLGYFHWYNLFVYLWGVAFILGVNQTTIAGAVATWYWCHDKKNLPRFVVLRSLYRTLRYNLGSVAFGTLLIALTRFIRLILLYISTKVRGSNNKVAKAILCCMMCCFACLEKFLKFLSKNAFIYMAIYGTSFCTSARRALELLTRNALRLIAVNFIGTFVILMSKLSVCVMCAGALYAYLMYEPYTKANLGIKFAPGVCIVAGFGCWMVASAFFGIYRMSTDTIFLCFCEDCERNDGSLERPYFMSKSLAKLTDVAPKFNYAAEPKQKRKKARKEPTIITASEMASPSN